MRGVGIEGNSTEVGSTSSGRNGPAKTVCERLICNWNHPRVIQPRGRLEMSPEVSPHEDREVACLCRRAGFCRLRQLRHSRDLSRAGAGQRRPCGCAQGGCADCKVLDIYFHDAKNLPLLEANFVVVHINIGQTGIDTNFDIADRYDVPLKRGVPALAVLDEHGKLLFSQKKGEFESMRHMESSSVTEFLVQWRAPKAGCSTVALNC
jgi:hypothetical protein